MPDDRRLAACDVARDALSVGLAQLGRDDQLCELTADHVGGRGSRTSLGRRLTSTTRPCGVHRDDRSRTQRREWRSCVPRFRAARSLHAIARPTGRCGRRGSSSCRSGAVGGAAGCRTGSIAARTPAVPRIGKQNAERRPAFTAAAGPRGKFASTRMSSIQAGSPLSSTRPGSPSPGCKVRLRVAARTANLRSARDASQRRRRRRDPDGGGVPPSESPIAASSHR